MKSSSRDTNTFQHFKRRMTFEELSLHLMLHIIERLSLMAGELDALRAQVARNTDVDSAAVALLRGIKAKLDAAIAAGDPAALQALSDTLGSSTDSLAAAITENTPAA
jgi:uncharacterized small protein (DUF1192 family)